MESSRRREEMDDGVGVVEERVRRMFPSNFMNWRRFAGVNAGPRPVISVLWRSRTWSRRLTFGLWREKNEVVVRLLAMLQKRQLVILG